MDKEKKHSKRMKKLAKKLKRQGYDLEDIVDVGEWYLNTLTVSDLLGVSAGGKNEEGEVQKSAEESSN